MESWIEIDKAALHHNYKQFSTILGGPDKLAVVLKSNAYGHGLNESFEALIPLKPAWLCVNYPEEGIHLRRLGFSGRIIIVGPTPAQQFASAAKFKLEIFLNSPDHLKSWLNMEDKPHIHIKFDTGMSRQGFFLEETDQILALIKSFPHLIAGVCSHFANVEDVFNHEFAKQQISIFNRVREKFFAFDHSILFHMASSAAALLLPESRFDLSRVGISFYGEWPSKMTRLSYGQIYGNQFDLRPALTWKTRVAQVKTIRQSSFVGYGCTFKAPRDMKVAVLPVGYFEGYARLVGEHQGYVLIDGKRCSLLGRVCMNMITVDVSHQENISVGDEVVLIGCDQNERIEAADFALWQNSINYEALTRINSEIPRRLT